MIDITNDMTQKMSNTNRLICQEALRRGWGVRIPYWYTSHFYIERDDSRVIHIYSSSPPALSFASAHLSNDKYATALVLSAGGIAQLPMCLVDGDIEDAAQQFVIENAPVIVKPLDGSHGNGITAGITSSVQLRDAIETACQKSHSGKALLQHQITGVDLKDVRVLVIDGRYVGAIHRVPARVYGDGQATVAELIDRENKQPHRGEPYTNKLTVISLDAARTFLGEMINRIPHSGEIVTVLGIANYGAGGELIDITESVPEWMRTESIQIADMLGLPVAGVDYMVAGEITLADQESDKRPIVIEVNKSPSLCIHDEPTFGESRGATKAYVDYLASL